MQAAPQREIKELIRVMSFNILRTRTGDEESEGFAENWRRRADFNVKTLKRYSPDLIGFQEFDDDHWAVYETQLTEYASFRAGAQDGTLSNAIFWKPERFDLVRSGVLPLAALHD